MGDHVAQVASDNISRKADSSPAGNVQRPISGLPGNYLLENIERPRISSINRFGIQTKLSIGPANDKYEQEADRVAEQVIRMPEPSANPLNKISNASNSIQRKCNSCEKEIRAQGKSLQTNGAEINPHLILKINSLSGRGTSMSTSERNFYEPRFGSDFSNIRIHNNAHANYLAYSINARAFTLGNNIVFGCGEYSQDSSSGKRLFAHELTHTIQQQDNSKNIINRTPNPDPPPDVYLEGRSAHDHVASAGRWALVQANAAAVCNSETTLIPSPIPGIPIPLVSERGRIECMCAVATPLQVLAVAQGIEMFNSPLAQSHLQHYINGGGVDLLSHSSLDDMLTRDAGARGKISAAIPFGNRGHVAIWQGDYSLYEFQLAFGGIDRVDYQVNTAAGTVDVWFKDRYDFHPAGFGYAHKGTGDTAPPGRITNCVHAAAVEAKLSGAADFWMKGHATVPLSLFTGSSGGSGADTL